MMKNVVSLFFLVLTSLLASCATAPDSQKQAGEMPAKAQTSSVTPSESLLEYTGKFLAMPAEAQKAELARVNQRLALNKVNFNDRTKAAVIYALSDTPEIRDVGKAQTLLDDLAQDHDPDMERATLVRILRGYLDENSRISKENSRLNQKIRDEQKRADTLQQKLEELKNIEKNIGDRRVLDK
jgi:hypothetical protein